MTTPDNPGQDALRPADPPLLIGFDEATTICPVPLPDAPGAAAATSAACWVMDPCRPGAAHPADAAVDGPPGPVLRTCTKAELYREVGR